MLLHERNQLFSLPSLSLEVIVVRSTGSGIHHEVDGAAATKYVGTRHNCLAASQPFRRSGVVE